MCNCQDTLIPQIGVVTDICTETADVKTFRVEKIGGGKLFEHLPGQCAILSVPGKGEAIFFHYLLSDERKIYGVQH